MPKKTREGIDRTDSRIIRLLQQDGRMPNTEIAARLGISEATVRSRLEQLIREKVIQIVAVGDPFKLGFGAVGVLKIRFDTKKVREVIRELQKIPEVWYIAVTTGTHDIDIEFNARSLTELHSLIFEKVNQIEGVLSTETSVVLQFPKRRYDWGTALDDDRD